MICGRMCAIWSVFGFAAFVSDAFVTFVAYVVSF